MRFAEVISKLSYALSLFIPRIQVNHDRSLCIGETNSTRNDDNVIDHNCKKKTDISLYASTPALVAQSANKYLQTKAYYYVVSLTKESICFLTLDYFSFCGAKGANNIRNMSSKTIHMIEPDRTITRIQSPVKRPAICYLYDDLQTTFKNHYENMTSKKLKHLLQNDSVKLHHFFKSENKFSYKNNETLKNTNNTLKKQDKITSLDSTEILAAEKAVQILLSYKLLFISMVICSLVFVMFKELCISHQIAVPAWKAFKYILKSICRYRRTKLGTIHAPQRKHAKRENAIWKLIKDNKLEDKEDNSNFYFQIEHKKHGQRMEVNNSAQISILSDKTNHVDNQVENINEQIQGDFQKVVMYLGENADDTYGTIVLRPVDLLEPDISDEVGNTTIKLENPDYLLDVEDKADNESECSYGSGGSDDGFISITTEEEYNIDKETNQQSGPKPLSAEEKEQSKRKFRQTYEQQVIKGQKRKQLIKGALSTKDEPIVQEASQEQFVNIIKAAVREETPISGEIPDRSSTTLQAADKEIAATILAVVEEPENIQVKAPSPLCIHPKPLSGIIEESQNPECSTRRGKVEKVEKSKKITDIINQYRSSQKMVDGNNESGAHHWDSAQYSNYIYKLQCAYQWQYMQQIQQLQQSRMEATRQADGEIVLSEDQDKEPRKQKKSQQLDNSINIPGTKKEINTAYVMNNISKKYRN